MGNQVNNLSILEGLFKTHIAVLSMICRMNILAKYSAFCDSLAIVLCILQSVKQGHYKIIKHIQFEYFR